MKIYELNGLSSMEPMNGQLSSMEPMNGQLSSMEPMNGQLSSMEPELGLFGFGKKGRAKRKARRTRRLQNPLSRRSKRMVKKKYRQDKKAARVFKRQGRAEQAHARAGAIDRGESFINKAGGLIERFTGGGGGPMPEEPGVVFSRPGAPTKAGFLSKDAKGKIFGLPAPVVYLGAAAAAYVAAKKMKIIK